MHDERAVTVVLELMEALQPTKIIHLGDLLDAHSISRWPKDPTRISRLQDEIDLAHDLLSIISQQHPQAEKWLLEGNHEDRLRRTVWELAGVQQELARLKQFGEQMSWPKLLGLEAIGWQWVPTGQQTKLELLPGIITKHGSVVRRFSGYTAKAEWERYGKSGLSGHTHRLSTFYHRDHNGAHVWVETGCTCDLDPEYVLDPDWQQGCVILSFDADGSRFNVEPVYIQDGKAIWRGRRYAA